MPDSCYDYRYERPVAKVITTCDECGEDICEGHWYYEINGETICKECMDSFAKIAEEE